ncbi:MAG TPA: hypothetical protein VGX00_01415 [Thermoplasmata archaeon]|nr:hypothetical protein [Thermoplasmata archaeon]
MKVEPHANGFFGVAPEKELDLKANFERFIEHLVARRRRAQPITIIIDGRETGVGKSSLAMNIARRLDPGFGLENVIFSAPELYRVYETKPPGSAALYDESVLGLLSRRGARDEELSGLIGALSIVRKNGIATLLCVPKIAMLDSIVVNGLAPHYIFIEARGRGRVHRAHKGAKYRKSQPKIPYDLWPEVSPIGWMNLDGDPFFEEYKVRAVEKNRAYFRKQQEISAAKEVRLLGGASRRAAANPSSLGNVPDRFPSSETPPPRSSTCRKCGRIFARSDALRRHEKTCGTTLQHPSPKGPIPPSAPV